MLDDARWGDDPRDRDDEWRDRDDDWLELDRNITSPRSAGRGRHADGPQPELLECRRSHGHDSRQEYYAGIKRERELEHDLQIYEAFATCVATICIARVVQRRADRWGGVLCRHLIAIPTAIDRNRGVNDPACGLAPCPRPRSGVV